MIFSSIVLFLSVIRFIQTTHFRGGTIIWKHILADENQATVNLTIKLGWRRSFHESTYCNQSDIIGGKKIIGERGLAIDSGYFSDSFFGVYCTDFSEKEDSSYGQVTIRVRYLAPYSDQIHLVCYAGGEWIPLLNHGDLWNMIARIDLSIQSHTGKINQSPITSMSPLIRVPTECIAEIKIPVYDADGDFVKCRWSVGVECGDSCKLPPNTELDSINCKIKFNLLPPIDGYYAIRLQIEDFSSITSTKSLSSIPLEFLVQAYKTSNCLFRIPSFEEPTKKDQTCIPIPSQTTYEDTILVNSNDIDNQISDIQTNSPPGLIKSNLNVFNKNLTLKYINVTWTPTINQNGISIFCFIGTTNSLISTEQRCFSLAVGFEPVEAKQNTAKPFGMINSNQKEWSIEFNQNISRPEDDKFIRFYETLTNKLVFEINTFKSDQIEILENKLIFKVANEFLEDKKGYFIGFDHGAFQSLLGCRVEMNQIKNVDFWPLYVKNCESCVQSVCKFNCSNNGICIDGNICFCNLGSKGENCEQNIETHSCHMDCGLNGVCFDSNKCICNYGFKGLNCEQVICNALNMCSNHGICIYKDPNDEECLCNDGWTSKDCSKPSSSATNSCKRFSCLGIILLVIFSIFFTSIIVIIFCVTKKKKQKNSISPRRT